MRKEVELFIHTTNELVREQVEHQSRVTEYHDDYAQAMALLSVTGVDDPKYQRRAAEVSQYRDRWLDACEDKRQMLALSSKRQQKVYAQALAKLDEVFS